MSGNPTPWAALYRHAITFAAKVHQLEPLVLLAVAWQESHGGVVSDAGRWTWAPQRLYRYEPGFWDRYMGPASRGWPKYEPPSEHPAVAEAWKRRVSSSYGILQVMFATAQDLGYGGSPEGLLDPLTSANLGAKLLRKNLDGPAKGDLADALAAYNTGRARDEWTTYDDEVLAKLERIRAYADTGADPFA
jgi:soluble lytic murein transglycosylase-like protein